MGLKLDLLGEFRLTRDGEGAAIVLGRRERALIAYLALSPRQRQSRERLATLLWGNRMEESARHSLSQTISVLRRALDDQAGVILVKDSDPLTFDIAGVTIDAVEFERLIADGSRAAIETALALYRGELMAGLSIKVGEFDDWLEGERRRLRDRAAEGLARLVSLYAEAGESEAAIATAQRLLALEPLHEEAHRTLMRLYSRSGRRAAALRHYQSFVAQLRRDLSADPEPETVRLFDDIRSQPPEGGGEGEVAAAALPPAAAAAAPTALSAVPAPAARRRKPIWRRSWLIAVGLGLAPAALVVAVLALAVVSAVFWRIPELAPAPLGGMIIDLKALAQVAEPPSIVVLPFQGRGADPMEQEFADGIGEDITTALSRVSEMLVISRQSALVYRDRPASVQRVAKELGVRYVLDGSVQMSGRQIRVSVALVDADRGHQIWAQRYDREVSDVFALQDEMTLEIITNIQVELGEGERERISLAHGTRSLEAWTLAGQALKLLRHLTPEDNAKARSLYERALALDPKYPGPHDGLAWTHFLDARFGWSASREASVQQAAVLAEQSLALDPTRARSYSLLGAIALVAGDFERAVTLGEKAVEMEANDSDNAALLAFTLTYTGEPQRAIALLQRAMRLSPYYPDWYRWMLARAHRLDGRTREAIALLLASGSADEMQSLLPLSELAAAYAESGQLLKAGAVAKDIRRLAPNFSVGAYLSMPPYADADTAEREAKALAAAGLPD